MWISYTATRMSRQYHHIKKINKSLSKLEGKKNKALKTKVNMHRTTFLEFEEELVLPHSDMEGIFDEDIEFFVDELAHWMPEFIANCNLIPESQERAEKSFISFVREIPSDGRTEFIYVFRVVSNYLGGVDADHIVEAGHGNTRPSIRTGRLYYESFIMPVETVHRDRHGIDNFTSKSVLSLVRDHEVKVEKDKERLWSSAMFDSADFSEVHKHVSDIFGQGEEWQLGNLFFPIKYKHDTLCACLLTPRQANVDSLASHFQKDFESILAANDLDRVSAETASFWQQYYRSWKQEKLSPVLGQDDRLLGCTLFQ